MKNIFIITKREYLTQVRKKSFILMTLISPILLILLTFFTIYITKPKKNYTVAVFDETHSFYKDFKSNPEVSYNFYDINQFKTIQDSLLYGENLDIIIHIPKTKDQLYNNIESETEIISNKNINKQFIKLLTKILENSIETKRKESLQINTEDFDKVKSFVNLKIIDLEGKNQGDSFIKEFLGISLAYIIMMFILIYGTRVMRNVTEEKNNRVVEIIISSVKPYELMIGKILGLTLVALTQFTIWIFLTLIMVFSLNYLFSNQLLNISYDTISTMNTTIYNVNDNITNNIKGTINTLLTLNYGLIIFIFLFYFFVGYLFYSSFFAAIGSIVDNDTETQQFLPLISIALLIGLYGSFSTINNPESPIILWLSMIPFTSPLVMVTRSVYNDIPLWELLTSIFIIIISVVSMIYISSKIYRIGILMYGKKISLKELWKWFRQS